MATKTLISEEEYLRTGYENPEPEYRDGEVVERSMADYLHGEVLNMLSNFFYDYWKKPGRKRLFVVQDVRVVLRAGRYVLPDMMVFTSERPNELVPSTPPHILIEVLSPDDRMSEVTEKLEEYRAWGAPNIWLLDPHGKKMYRQTEQGLTAVSVLSVPEMGIEIRRTDVFTY